jgi:GMP synthase-like glutamine amidotransferase
MSNREDNEMGETQITITDEQRERLRAALNDLRQGFLGLTSELVEYHIQRTEQVAQDFTLAAQALNTIQEACDAR